MVSTGTVWRRARLACIGLLLPATAAAQEPASQPSARDENRCEIAIESVSADLARCVGEAEAAAASGARLRILIRRFLFERGEDTLLPDNEAFLETLASELVAPRYRRWSIIATGHTDRIGTRGENIELSLRRAQAATSMLLGTGLPEDRVLAAGLADADAENWTREALQRRVEIELYRPTSTPLAHPAPEAYRSGEGVPADLRPLSTGVAGDERFSPVAATVDFWVTPIWAANATSPYAPTVMALTGIDGTRYSVHIARDMRHLAIWDGQNTLDGYHVFPVDLRDGRMRHVTLAVTPGETRAFVDGVDLGTVAVGFGPATAEALRIGGFDHGTGVFGGPIRGLRLWDRVAGPEDAAALAQAVDPAEMGRAWHEALLARLSEGAVEIPPAVIPLSARFWSEFGAHHVRIQNRETFQNGVEGAIVGAPAAGGKRVRRPDTDNATDRVFSGFDIFQIEMVEPDYIGLEPEWIGDVFAADSTRVLARGTGGDGGVETVETRRTRTDPRGATVPPNRGDAVAFRITPVLSGEAAPWTGAGDTPEHQRHRLTVQSGHGVFGLAVRFGRVDGERAITGLKLLTDGGEITLLGSPLDVRDDGPWQRHFLPVGTPFGGMEVAVEGTGAGERLRAVRLLGAGDPATRAIVMTDEMARIARFEEISRNRYRALSAHVPFTEAKHAELSVLDSGLVTLEDVDVDLVPVPPSVPADAMREDAFNNIFVVQAKAVSLEANYTGYDITRMDPIHLVHPGASGRVFAMPRGDSRDYYDVNRTFVPRGLLYVPEFTGATHSHAHFVKTTSDYRRAMSNTVSASVGVPEVAKFSASVTTSQVNEAMREKNHSLTVGFARSVFYDLVLNKGEMGLDPDFVARVERLRDRPDFDGFIRHFGTHYADTVVYGGLGVSMIEFDELTYGRVRGRGLSLKVGAEAQTKELSGSISASTSSEVRSGFRQAVGDNYENFYWIGGTHGGYGKESWSVGTDGVVPVHVALRPIHELLAPPFFDDPAVVHGLRQKLRRAVDDYLEAAASRARGEAALLPTVVRVTLTGASLNNPGDDFFAAGLDAVEDEASGVAILTWIISPIAGAVSTASESAASPATSAAIQMAHSAIQLDGSVTADPIGGRSLDDTVFWRLNAHPDNTGQLDDDAVATGDPLNVTKRKGRQFREGTSGAVALSQTHVFPVEPLDGVVDPFLRLDADLVEIDRVDPTRFGEILDRPLRALLGLTVDDPLTTDVVDIPITEIERLPAGEPMVERVRFSHCGRIPEQQIDAGMLDFLRSLDVANLSGKHGVPASASPLCTEGYLRFEIERVAQEPSQ